MEYDDRLRVDHFEVTGGASGYLMRADYTYFADSRTSYKNDLQDDRFDRVNRYDFAGRLVFNQFGAAINHNNQSVRVYEQSISYDGFSRMTQRIGVHWGEAIGYAASYVNGRLQNSSGTTYDAAGNIVHSGSTFSPHDYQKTDFDAAGRRVKYFSSSKGRMGSVLNIVRESQTEYTYDGDGRPVTETFGYQDYPVTSPQPQMEVAVKGYQIWSTVLGSALTSIEPDGTKKGTRVFAGGAVIASHGTDDAGWITADPVTGSSIGYDHFTKENNNKEREPLGQEVLQYDPTADEVGAPPPNETLSGWQDMQWQCDMPKEFYGGFDQMPWHCQNSYILDKSLNGEQLWHIGWIQKENPNKVTGKVNASHEGLQINLTPTEKPETGEAGEVVPEASVPDNDGGRSQVFEQQYDAGGNVSFGKGAGVSVSVSAGLDMTAIPGFVGAENGNLSQQNRKLTKKEIVQIRGQLSTALDDKTQNGKKCNDFLKETLRELGITDKSILDIYDLYAKKKAIYSGTGGGAPYPANSRKARLEIDLNEKEFVLEIFHELVHGAGKITSFTHVDMGEAMYAAGRKLNLLDERELPVGDQEKLSSDINARFQFWGIYFNIAKDALEKACGGDNND